MALGIFVSGRNLDQEMTTEVLIGLPNMMTSPAAPPSDN